MRYKSICCIYVWYVFMYVCMHMYVCMYVYLYAYVCMLYVCMYLSELPAPAIDRFEVLLDHGRVPGVHRFPQRGAAVPGPVLVHVCTVGV